MNPGCTVLYSRKEKFITFFDGPFKIKSLLPYLFDLNIDLKFLHSLFQLFFKTGPLPVFYFIFVF
jgi:hypothetical protein